jgi:endonuclease/exonuclease/phosphatase family metal-dependent hydrolase
MAATGIGRLQGILFITHFSLDIRERLLQAQAMAGRQWLGSPALVGPAVLCGDLNCSTGSPACRVFNSFMKNTARGKKPATWMSRWLIAKIDHILVSKEVQVHNVLASATDLDKAASDHLPLIADVSAKAV